jgi:FkbM family methyltransferase
VISYAQNFEDVILARALAGIENGFYVDIGAWSPDVDSVTKHFYNLGWNGINVEPNPIAFQEFERIRINDINRSVAISDKNGVAKLNILDNSGLSTLDESVAQYHENFGVSYREVEVMSETLSQLLSSIENLGEIHFLKVDVEGYEAKVLQGNDWNRFRPWIVLIEATYPMTRIETHYDAEIILLQNSYKFVYEDGLNRFYLDENHQELVENFRFPPNLFDDFIRQSEHVSKEKESDLVQVNLNLENQLDECQQIIIHLQEQLVEKEDASNALQAVLLSNSWRITSPIRAISNLFINPNRRK